MGYGKAQYRSQPSQPDEEEAAIQEMDEKPDQMADDEKMVDDDLDRKISSKSSEEIGSEFVDAVSSGLSAAMMDPNRKNKVHGFKTNNVLTQLQPEFGQKLEKESYRRYEQWMKPLPVNKDGQPKALPPMKKIDPKLVTMTTTTKHTVNFQPTLPEI